MASVSIPEPNVLVLQGEIDLHAAPRVKEGLLKLLAENPRRVFVDLSRVSYIDSSGLAVLIEAMQRVHAYGGELALLGLRDTVEVIFHIARLDQVFRIFPHKAAAEAALAP
jgi:anti-sigma B factor antagonist